MESRPFFSIVIPTYNRANILHKAIDSVLEQSMEDFELIIIDNGSTDGTKEWLSSNYSDYRIRYFYQSGTGSPAGPRNTGINRSNGKWICFLDSDDLWKLNKLEIVQQVIESHKTLDVICHNEILSLMGVDTDNVLFYGPFEKNFYRAMLIGGNRLSTSATCIRNSFLKENQLSFNESPDYVIVEDYDLWLRLARKGAVFYFIDEPLGKYVVEDGCLSLNSNRTRKNTEAMLRSHVYQLQDFSDNRGRLWGVVKFRLIVQDVKGDIANGKYMRGVLRIIYHVCTSPLGALYYIKALINRKIRISSQVSNGD